MKKSLLYIFCVFSILFSSCEEYLQPNPFEETMDEDFVWNSTTYAEGVLLQAFNDLHPNSWRTVNNELMAVLTDDAVSSNLGSTAGNFSQGLQSPYYNLSYLNTWKSDYANIYSINKFLENLGSAKYDPNPATNKRFINKYKGDAFFLRAYYHWKLLKRFGGLADEKMMGVPVVKNTLSINESYDLPRSTYMETVMAIVEDCDSALTYVPEEYEGDDIVNGIYFYGSPTKAVVKSLVGIVYSFAASPAYNIDNNVALWDSAASKLAEALISIDGTLNSEALLPRNFHEPENPDVVWRSPYLDSNYGNEVANYPPSLRGNGLTNPSQNLVDAFPDAQGYPISESNIYDASKPYEKRDARFYKTILYNEAIIGTDSTTIETYVGGNNSRQLYNETGTRTGYYLKKLLSNYVTLFPERRGVEPTYYVSISKTDLYLLFAEAMNELAGPYDSRYGLSARNALLKIRKRAGYNPDLYLFLVSSKGKDVFREVIRNERRIELCFEDKRYWDLRRWNNIEEINTEVTGVEITKVDSVTFNYTYKTIEEKKYESVYNPIPYEEVLKMNNLTQNTGW